MKLVLADIEEAPLKMTAESLTASGAEVEAVPTDVSDGSDVEALRDRALERFGAVHLVHNNAGVGVGGPLWMVSEVDWKWILGVNLWGVVHGIRTFVPLLVDQGEGHIVNTASVAGLTSPGFLGPYNATKHAVTTISETLFRDLRATGSSVGVSVLCPGFVRTGIALTGRRRSTTQPATGFAT
jgi:NAD(P)-dependent dehydrogenase (short-subunit alcohol dehydrogenase family)